MQSTTDDQYKLGPLARGGRMTLAEYLASTESKYAVIRADSYAQDEVAQSISASPRRFTIDGVEFVILSLEPMTVPQLAAYAEQVANGVEFELTVGSGKVTLLLHSEATALLESYQEEPG